MFEFVAKKLFGSKNERELRKLWPLVEKINSYEESFKKHSLDALAAKTGEFKQRIERGESLDSLLPEAFATVREASVRVLGMRHFDVQLIGGLVLHSGKIAEMKTGEGKTLCATLPIYLNALPGKGVHLVTVNDYLARRDAETMGRLYGALGLTTGVVLSGLDPEDRQEAYSSDITYGQNNEFGFDFLRDNMKLELGDKAQRKHFFAIVDEVDSILVDEARTPLIISGPAEDATDKYATADEIVRRLTLDTHFSVDIKSKQVMLSDDGVKFIEELMKIDNLYEPTHISLVHHVQQALKAHVTMIRDVDYVVRNAQVIIVDEFTGRLMAGRRWSDGLHQAVEAKEKVKVARENQTLATITFQNYFRMYSKLAGMTGTADTEAVEFKKIYNLDVVIIPTNQPMIREDNPDVVFVSEPAKFKAVCDEIEEGHKKGQPVLVGTASIAKSEVVSELLQKRGIKHHVLNAKQHEKEAEIIAQAGRYGGVTISTNMAGRGTDIVLGGNAEFLAAAEVGTRDHSDDNFVQAYKNYREICLAERNKVVAAGGLHIIGTERHESRRIDNQLRGRSGRQGDPGSSRFYVSLEDDLMKRFGGERMKSIMSRMGMQEEDAIEGRLVARAIENAQKKVEGYHFDIRKHLLEYDNVMNKQREVIYSLREKMLRGDTVEEYVLETIDDAIEDIISVRATEKDSPEKWDLEGIGAEMQKVFALEYHSGTLTKRGEGASVSLAQELYEEFGKLAKQRYQDRKSHFGEARMLKLERIIFLQAIDHFWKEHLSNIEHLREGIGLRGYGQKNPLYEYQSEAFQLFASMMMATKVAVLQNVFIPELPSDEELTRLEEKELELQRQREVTAQAVHEEVIASASVAESSIVQKLVQKPVASEEQIRLALEDKAKREEARKEEARKKAKQQKKARKSNR